MASNRLETELTVVKAENAFKTIDKFYDQLNEVDKRINSLGANSRFAKDFEQRLVQVDRQTQKTRRGLLKLGTTRIKGNALDGLSQSAIRLEKEARRTQVRLRALRRAARAGSGSESYIKQLAQDAVIAEKQLARLDRRSRQLQRRQQARQAGSGGGSGSGLALAGGLRAGAAGLGIGVFIAGARQAANAQRRLVDGNLVLKASAIETGIAYEKLAAQAVEFGDAAKLSNGEAATTFAQLVNFANAAGRSDKIELFRKRFIDLAAAKGINASQLGDISRQLNALTDEATDKLLNANPSAFYEAFAVSIGKTAASLSDAEKRAAIFDEVIRKGALFEGQAQQKAQGLSGDLDTLALRFKTLTEQVGKFVEPGVKFLRVLTDIIAASAGDGKAFKSLQELIAGDNGEATAAKVRKTLATQQDIFKEFEKLQANRSNDKFSNFDSLVSSFANQSQSLGFTSGLTFLNKDAATIAKEQQEFIKRATENANTYRTAFQKELKDVLGGGASVDLLELEFAKFQQQQGILPPDLQIKIRQQFNKAISAGVSTGFNNAIKTARDNVPKLREILANVANDPRLTAGATDTLLTQARDRIAAQIKAGTDRVQQLKIQTDSLFNRISANDGSNNPFVKVFSDAERQIEQTRKQVSFLSSDLQKIAFEAARTQTSTRLFSSRLTNSLSVLGLRNEAQAFEDPDRALSLNERLQSQIDLINQTNRRQPTAANLGGTGLFNNFAINLPSGASDAEQQRIRDQRVITLTQGANPADLTDNLRDVAASARLREADRLEGLENAARENRLERTRIQDSIDKNIKGLLDIAKSDGLTGVIRIVNDSDDAKVELGQRPNQKDTTDLMN